MYRDIAAMFSRQSPVAKRNPQSVQYINRVASTKLAV